MPVHEQSATRNRLDEHGSAVRDRIRQVSSRIAMSSLRSCLLLLLALHAGISIPVCDMFYYHLCQHMRANQSISLKVSDLCEIIVAILYDICVTLGGWMMFRTAPGRLPHAATYVVTTGGVRCIGPAGDILLQLLTRTHHVTFTRGGNPPDWQSLATCKRLS